jgi:itaconyl-CoA hydratase
MQDYDGGLSQVATQTPKGRPDHYWDALTEGDLIHSPGITVSEAHLVQWAGLTGDWVSLHLDAEYASTTQFGQRIGHGPLTLSVGLGLLTQTGYFTNVTAWLGLDEARRAAGVHW